MLSPLANTARAESKTIVALVSGGTAASPKGATSLTLLGVLPMKTGIPALRNSPIATRRLLSYCLRPRS